MDCLLIINPNARDIASGVVGIDDIIACLNARGIGPEVWMTTGPDDSTSLCEKAAAQGREMVIIAGGDGAVNGAVNGLAGSDTALGIIPVGTGNVLGHALGLEPADVAAACEMLARGVRKRIDLGCMNGRYFVNMAGVGLDAQVAREVGEQWKSLLGRYAFIGQFVATAVTLEPWEYTMRIDGEESVGEMWGVFVCNSPLYTWRVSLAPNADESDGLLDFVVFHTCPRQTMIQHVAELFTQEKSAADFPDMAVIRGEQMELNMRPPGSWQVEGEVGGNTPVECHVAHRALTLMMGEGGFSPGCLSAREAPI